MLTITLIFFGKLITKISRAFNLGHGSTWPGHIALGIDKNFIKKLLKNSGTKIIIIAGTNGKTTTAKLIQTILEKNKYKVFRNISGANLLNGIASTILLNTNVMGKLNADFAIFEVDENSLPLALEEFTPDFMILLNLFRDQLDRYGEIDSIAKKWHSALKNLPPSTTVILNADDPQIAFLGTNLHGLSSRVPLKAGRGDLEIASPAAPDRNGKKNARVLFFGLDDPKIAKEKMQHAVDSVHCLHCSSNLNFSTIYFSHLGDWKCDNCNIKRPKLSISQYDYYPLSGLYNRYNTLASVLLGKTLNIPSNHILDALKGFVPAFGRQEILIIDNKKIRLFLSKNPTSMNESLRTIKELYAKQLLIVLNDRIPDGRDVSWIWDVDFEEYAEQFKTIYVSGDRVFDMALRLKYAGIQKIQNYADLKDAVKTSLEQTPKPETLYILPTYSAMLEVRKILVGRKIL